eukprot:gene5766-7962_t
MVNALGVSSAVVVASRETIILGSYNFCCFVIIAIIFVWYGTSSIIDDPILQTFYRIQHNKSLVKKASVWIEIMREAIDIKQEFLKTPTEIADINRLEDAIRDLRGSWLSARSCGSIFQTPINDFLEELLIIHSKYNKFSLRKYDYWDKEYEDSRLVHTFSRNERMKALLAPKKRRILIKLLAFRYIRGDHIKNNKGFHFDLAKETILNEQKLMKAKLFAKKEEEEKRKIRLMKRNERLRNELLYKIFGRNVMNYINQLFLMNYNHKKMDEMKKEYHLLNQNNDNSNDIMDDNNNNNEDGFLLDKIDVEDLEANHNEQQLMLALFYDEKSDENDNNDDSDVDEQMKFDPLDIIEAEKMLIRLKDRSEIAIKRYNVTYLQSILDQAVSESIAKSNNYNNNNNHNNSTQNLLSLNVIKENEYTNDDENIHQSIILLRELIDEEEQRDLEELYLLWDEAIQLYEVEQFPGDYEKLNNEVENWYTYRQLISERLEIVMKVVDENNYAYDEDDILSLPHQNELMDTAQDGLLTSPNTIGSVEGHKILSRYGHGHGSHHNESFQNLLNHANNHSHSFHNNNRSSLNVLSTTTSPIQQHDDNNNNVSKKPFEEKDDIESGSKSVPHPPLQVFIESTHSQSNKHGHPSSQPPGSTPTGSSEPPTSSNNHTPHSINRKKSSSLDYKSPLTRLNRNYDQNNSSFHSARRESNANTGTGITTPRAPGIGITPRTGRSKVNSGIDSSLQTPKKNSNNNRKDSEGSKRSFGVCG